MNADGSLIAMSRQPQAMRRQHLNGNIALRPMELPSLAKCDRSVAEGAESKVLHDRREARLITRKEALCHFPGVMLAEAQEPLDARGVTL
jgi:hypothetical protein